MMGIGTVEVLPKVTALTDDSVVGDDLLLVTRQRVPCFRELAALAVSCCSSLNFRARTHFQQAMLEQQRSVVVQDTIPQLLVGQTVFYIR